MTGKFKHLPVELDNETIIFSYGSLLIHEKLRELLAKRGEFEILETSDAAEAARLVRANPKDIVILKNVRLENVRVTIVTETILRRWYKASGGEIRELIDAGVTSPEIPQALFLYARPARRGEKGRTLGGGLICNLSKEEILNLDKYEFEPVLTRTLAPELKIGDRNFIPKYIAFYAGNVSPEDISAEEKAERARLLGFGRKRGALSPQACWQRNVRHN